jgi:hypothetical protein
MSEEEFQRSWIEAELEETLDDLFEAEFNQPILTDELRKIYKDKHPDMLDRRTYYSNLLRLQSELVKLQDWVEHTKSKVLIICEGRDSAGKGGVIKRITQRMNPRVARVVALARPDRARAKPMVFPTFCSTSACRVVKLFCLTALGIIVRAWNALWDLPVTPRLISFFTMSLNLNVCWCVQVLLS